MCGALKLSGSVRANFRLNIAIAMLFLSLIKVTQPATCRSPEGPRESALMIALVAQACSECPENAQECFCGESQGAPKALLGALFWGTPSQVAKSTSDDSYMRLWFQTSFPFKSQYM